jgi:hypothetical protein
VDSQVALEDAVPLQVAQIRPQGSEPGAVLADGDRPMSEAPQLTVELGRRRPALGLDDGERRTAEVRSRRRPGSSADQASATSMVARQAAAGPGTYRVLRR